MIGITDILLVEAQRLAEGGKATAHTARLLQEAARALKSEGRSQNHFRSSSMQKTAQIERVVRMLKSQNRRMNATQIAEVLHWTLPYTCSVLRSAVIMGEVQSNREPTESWTLRRTFWV